MNLMFCILSRVSQCVINLYVTKTAALLVEQHCLYTTIGSPSLSPAGENYNVLQFRIMQCILYHYRFGDQTTTF